MNRFSARVRASIMLAATLLPLYVFAAPLRLQLVRCDSSITDVPELNAQAFQERTTYGLTQAVTLAQGKASLVTPGDLEGADVLVGGKLGRSGTRFRLVYVIQTKHEPKLNKQLAYEFSSPRLSDRGVTVMAQEVVSEAVKLEEARKAQAAQPPAPEVASASAPAAAPSSSNGLSSPPAPETPSAPEESPESEESEETIAVRTQPLVVIHTGLAGLWGAGTRNYGLGAVLEPKWNITDSIAAGIRFDGGFTFGGSIDPQGVTTVSQGLSAAMLAKGEFFFRTTGVRPFLGLGAGVYALANQNASASTAGAGVAQSGGRFFGVAPQLGIDFGTIRLGVTYNHILGADIVVEQNISVGLEAERIHRNYVQLEFSGRLFSFNAPRRQPVSRLR